MKFLADEFEQMCVTTYDVRPDRLPIARRLALEMAFFSGARAFREGLACGSMPLMEAIEIEMQEFGDTIVQRHADAGLSTGFPPTIGEA